MTNDEQRAAARRGHPLSVRTRIVTVITIVTALGLIAVGLSTYLVERHRILDQIDDRLAANLESARYIVESGPGADGEWASSSDALAGVVERMSPDDNTGVIGMADGRITTLPGVELDLDLRDESEFAEHVENTRRADEPMTGTYAEDGVVWQYLAAPIRVSDSPAPEQTVFVMVYDVDAELNELDLAARAFLTASAVVVAVVAATGTLVATRLLRPLRQMRETAQRVSAKSLDERIPVVGRDDVAELAGTMNDMLDRLDDALDSQRQLLSDVGHELKTPLTIVRGNIELMDPDDPADARDTRDLTLDEIQRMAQLVDDISAAAALHGARPVQRAPVDLADLLQQVVRKAEAIDGATVSLAATVHGVALLDSDRITQAMLQLVQNSVTHGGGDIELGSASADGRTLELWVRDHGPGVPAEAQHHIFERFARGPGAEERAGSGLGLSIVRVIAGAHDGEVSVRNDPEAGARFTIRIPMQSAEPHHQPHDNHSANNHSINDQQGA